MKKRGFINSVVALCFGALTAFSAQAQTLGKEYVLVEPPQATDSAAKVEVLEFFSYGCIHCFRLHPFITKWAAGAAKDVEFKRVPVTFDRPQMRPMAKLFYTLEATGDLAKLDDAVFKALHDENANMSTDKSVLDWIAKKGVDMKKFTETYNSFGIQSKVSRAEQMTKAYRVQGTPQVYVDGKYAVRNEGATGYESIPVITGQLVDKARAEKSKKK
jgi:thiol:disulfide interchange protein DsbA